MRSGREVNRLLHDKVRASTALARIMRGGRENEAGIKQSSHRLINQFPPHLTASKSWPCMSCKAPSTWFYCSIAYFLVRLYQKRLTSQRYDL